MEGYDILKSGAGTSERRYLFNCHCGCVFIANENSINKYSNTAECPECGEAHLYPICEYKPNPKN